MPIPSTEGADIVDRLTVDGERDARKGTAKSSQSQTGFALVLFAIRGVFITREI